MPSICNNQTVITLKDLTLLHIVSYLVFILFFPPITPQACVSCCGPGYITTWTCTEKCDIADCQSSDSVSNGVNRYEPFKDEAQTALFKDPVRTAQ